MVRQYGVEILISEEMRLLIPVHDGLELKLSVKRAFGGCLGIKRR